MTQVAPFHCLQQLVYHSNDHCPQAQTIALADQRAGRGGKTECLCCRHLNKSQYKKSRTYGVLHQLIAKSNRLR